MALVAQSLQKNLLPEELKRKEEVLHGVKAR